MTKSDQVQRYQSLASGRTAVESHLHSCTAEFLNADIAQRIVTNVAQSHSWIQRSLFWVRLFQNPSAYGFQTPGLSPDTLAAQAMQLYVDAPLQKLHSSGLIEVAADSGNIIPLEPSRC
jgi:hypothetical protein